MYKKILVALDHTEADHSLLPHISKLASQLKSELLLVHVADGWVARNFDQLKLAESEEMQDDGRYLEQMAQRMRAEAGLSVDVRLALGNPPDQIMRVAEEEHCDLIAMTSHGHRLVGDLFLGSTIEAVRHRTSIPLLIVRAESPRPDSA
ncbi:MAG: universal stress protein [bacterium]